MTLGLSADEVLKVNDYVDDLKIRRGRDNTNTAATAIKDNVVMVEFKLRVREYKPHLVGYHTAVQSSALLMGFPNLLIL